MHLQKSTLVSEFIQKLRSDMATTAPQTFNKPKTNKKCGVKTNKDSTTNRPCKDDVPFGETSVSDMTTEEFSQFAAKIDSAARDLATKGYAVIPALFTNEECEEYKARVWSFLGNLGFSQSADFSKKRATDLPPHSHGIIHSYRWNHGIQITCSVSNLIIAKPFRELRKNPKVLAVFSRLNGSPCLVGSLDRVNFKFPGRKYGSQGSWAHVDQNPRNLGLRYVQSYVTFTEGTAKSPQNRFYEGSHLIFDSFFASKRTAQTSDAWIRLTPQDKEDLVNIYNCKLVKPTCPPGSMVLWDSRMVHDPDEGSDFHDGRLVVYLCYSRYCPEMEQGDFLKKKSQAFQNCRSTPHVPFPQTLFPKTVRTYGKAPGPYDEISESLLGYDPTDEEAMLPDLSEKLLFGFHKYPKTKLGYGNPLLKEWFGSHPVIDKTGSPLLKFTPFSVGPIPFDGPKLENTDVKNSKKRKCDRSIKTMLTKKRKPNLVIDITNEL